MSSRKAVLPRLRDFVASALDFGAERGGLIDFRDHAGGDGFMLGDHRMQGCVFQQLPRAEFPWFTGDCKDPRWTSRRGGPRRGAT